MDQMEMTMAKSSKPAEATIEKVRLAVTEAPEPRTATELAEGVGVGVATVRKCLTLLVQASAVTKDDEGRYVTKARRERTRTEQVRGEAAADRDKQLLALLAKAGEDGMKVTDLAEALGITSGAARHCCWRLSGKPIGGKNTSDDIRVELHGRGTFRLAREKKS